MENRGNKSQRGRGWQKHPRRGTGFKGGPENLGGRAERYVHNNFGVLPNHLNENISLPPQNDHFVGFLPPQNDHFIGSRVTPDSNFRGQYLQRGRIRGGGRPFMTRGMRGVAPGYHHSGNPDQNFEFQPNQQRGGERFQFHPNVNTPQERKGIFGAFPENYQDIYPQPPIRSARDRSRGYEEREGFQSNLYRNRSLSHSQSSVNSISEKEIQSQVYRKPRTRRKKSPHISTFNPNYGINLPIDAMGATGSFDEENYQLPPNNYQNRERFQSNLDQNRSRSHSQSSMKSDSGNQIRPQVKREPHNKKKQFHGDHFNTNYNANFLVNASAIFDGKLHRPFQKNQVEVNREREIHPQSYLHNSKQNEARNFTSTGFNNIEGFGDGYKIIDDPTSLDDSSGNNWSTDDGMRPLSRNSSYNNNVVSESFDPLGTGFSSEVKRDNENSNKTKKGRQTNKQKRRESIQNTKPISQNQNTEGENFTFEQMEALLQKEPLEILHSLTEVDFSSMFHGDSDPKLLILTVDVLSKICVVDPSDEKGEVLRQASQPEFLNCIFSLVSDFPYIEDVDVLNQANSCFGNLITLYNTLCEFMPSGGRVWRNHLLEVDKALKEIAKNQFIQLDLNLIRMTKSLLDDFIGNSNEEVEVDTPKPLKKKETYFPEPVGNFRTVSLYPRPEDIYSEQPFIYPNITDGPYRSVEHYLDIHFKLLREDFMSPIRQAMKDFKKQCNTKERFKRVDNVRIYRKTKFLHPKTFADKVVYEVCFDVDKRINRVNWEFSNRFLFGSLLFFTNDNFDTFFLATVANRNVKDLEKKLVLVELVQASENVKSILGKEFIMAESEAYFEPYFHVLKALQRFDETNLPLSKYIVDINTETEPPKYLSPVDVYSIRMNEQNFNFRVLSEIEWPSHDELGLDPSQFEAFKSALTNDLVVIQGPPGTGKTFLGLKIAQGLLANAQIWNQSNNPILVVCFTNHALDQFLEGLLPFTTKLVRIGGKSKGSELDKFNIRERRREYSYYRKTQGKEMRLLHLQMSTKFAELKTHQMNVQLLDDKDGVLSLKTLELVMNDHQRNYFRDDDQLLNWLLIGVGNVQQETKVKITITADRGVVKEEVAQMNPLMADAEDQRIKQAFFDAIDLDPVPPSEDTVKVHYACNLKAIQMKRDEILEQLQNNGRRMSRHHLISSRNTIEHLNMVIAHLRKELLEAKKFPRSQIEEQNLLGEMWLDRLPPDARWRLYHTWVNILRNGLMVELGNKEKEFKELSFRYEQFRQADDIAILKTSHVVGTTTTLAAKFQPMFAALAPKIVIVEEAAEVLEAHIIASLSPSCEHLILIGDHKQLRPNVAEMRLARQYHLDVSLFERMVKNGMACHTLTLQHRMRPEISKQLVPTIYPTLKDDPSVLTREDIKGMDKNVFFMTHKRFEEEVEEITSKRNPFEADIVLKLAKYLVLQGYKPQEITILATYKGQMYHMKNEIKKLNDFPKGIQITIVDNFQGEENRIILLSLVRSNAVDKIGFLEIENRICVALSRARDGLYIVGNMDGLVKRSDIWAKIKSSLVKQEAFGTSLLLRCQIHPNQLTTINSGQDFIKVSEGGCSVICNQPLPCGHNCKSMCHIAQDYHQRYKCREPCPKILCQEGHQCPKKCHQQCGDCQVPVRKVLPCEHVAQVPCYMDMRMFKCLEQVETVAQLCGHKVTVACHMKNNPQCNLPCTTRLECGHSCERECHASDDPDHLEYACLKPCARLNKNCSENHACRLACFEECNPCPVMIKKKLPCDHMSPKLLCSTNFTGYQCKVKCERTIESCGHPCNRKCWENCQPCLHIVEKTVPGCNHTVKMACGERPSRQICEGPCQNVLQCGHKCSKRCKDICAYTDCEIPVPLQKTPLGLRNPSEKNLFSAFISFLNKEKIVSLPCGHMEAAVPCNKVNFVDLMSPEELMQYCVHLCGQELICKHVCSGTCSECMQGRIHKVCNEPCGNVLICGHSCKVPCREVCPPCNEPCRHECKHSKCSRKCGETCVACSEPCEYACPHKKCSRRCGEICDRDPCYEPCPLTCQACGRQCVGFCGEPCPPCRACEPHHFEEFFYLGDETEEDSKWVYLEDCKHTFETNGLESWLNVDLEGSEIGCKVCPRCKTPIVRTQRFMNLIKTMYLDIQKVKLKCFGNPAEIKKERLDALRKLQQVEFVEMELNGVRDELKWLYEKLKLDLPEVKQKKRNVLHLQKTQLLCFFTNFFISLYNRKQEVWGSLNDEAKDILSKKINFLTRLLKKREQKISQQEMNSFELEVKRIHRLCDLLFYTSSPEYRMSSSYSGAANTRKAAEQVIFSTSVYSDEQDSKMKSLLATLKQQIRSSAELSDAERAMINKAMSSSFRSVMKTGHWFKCKNGHTYCITECGGAMEEAVCPFRGCGEKIGGRNHSLRSDQRLASEMDGARHAAWSDANNMANFGFF